MNSEASVKEITKSVWGASPAGSTHAKHHRKGTKEFFESFSNSPRKHDSVSLNLTSLTTF